MSTLWQFVGYEEILGSRSNFTCRQAPSIHSWSNFTCRQAHSIHSCSLQHFFKWQNERLKTAWGWIMTLDRLLNSAILAKLRKIKHGLKSTQIRSKKRKQEAWGWLYLLTSLPFLGQTNSTEPPRFRYERPPGVGMLHLPTLSLVEEASGTSGPMRPLVSCRGSTMALWSPQPPCGFFPKKLLFSIWTLIILDYIQSFRLLAFHFYIFSMT